MFKTSEIISEVLNTLHHHVIVLTLPQFLFSSVGSDSLKVNDEDSLKSSESEESLRRSDTED